MAEPGGARVGSRCPTASHSHSIFLSSTYLPNPSLKSRFANARFHAGNLPFFFRLSISLCPMIIYVFICIPFRTDSQQHNPVYTSRSSAYIHRKLHSLLATLCTAPRIQTCGRSQKSPCNFLARSLFYGIYRIPPQQTLVCGGCHNL